MRQTMIPLVLALALPLTGCDDKKKSDDESSEEGGDSKKKELKKKQRKVHKEALNNVGAMSRGATAAYEREVAWTEEEQEAGEQLVAHHLCKSAEEVPAKVPAGKAYQPNASDGADFKKGDSTTGWPCLKVSITTPIRCQYSYIVGKGFKSTKRGNKAIDEATAMKDGHAMAFEAAAECDIDGDGETSLYAATGTVDPKTKQLKRSKKVFIDKEGE